MDAINTYFGVRVRAPGLHIVGVEEAAVTMRLDADEARYQAARASGDTRPLYAEELVRDFKHWRIVKTRFPHTRIADEHHMIVLKRGAELADITATEWAEFLHIIGKVQHRYDNLVFNLPSMTSVRHLPHFHLYRLKAELRAPAGQRAVEVTS